MAGGMTGVDIDTLHARLAALRTDEVKFTEDALSTMRVYGDAGRPAAVDGFIDGSLAAARSARRAAAKIERQLARCNGSE